MNYVDTSRLKDIVPAWAADVRWLAEEMDRQLHLLFDGAGVDPHRKLGFWFDLVDGYLRLATPRGDGSDQTGQLIIDGIRNPLGSPCQVVVPLNSIMAAFRPLGSHSLYCHGIQTETALYYFGITKQRWHARLAQHLSGARTGSPYVFHRALAQHAGKRMLHRLLDPALPFEHVMRFEEDFVGEFSLYPKGMNMIPGGFAGLRYLATLGYRATSVGQRDAAIERLAKMPTVKGKPNPLCTARWAADQDFVNRVICGHGDRLTVEQVRQVRLLNGFGHDLSAVMLRCGLANRRQVRGVMTGGYYGRVA